MTENSFDQQVVIKNYKMRFLIFKIYIKNFSQYYWTLWQLMILCFWLRFIVALTCDIKMTLESEICF